MNRDQVAIAVDRLERCKQIVRDIDILIAASNANSLSKCSFTDWNSGADLISPKSMLRDVINAGCETLIKSLEAELQSIALVDPEPEVVSIINGDTHITIIPIPDGLGGGGSV